MDLESEVRTVIRASDTALTVDNVTMQIADRIRDEVKAILNAMAERKEIQMDRGAAGRKSTYAIRPAKIKRRIE